MNLIPKNRPASKHPCKRRKSTVRKGREEKYLNQFARVRANKRRRLERELRKNPDNKQVKERLKTL